MARPSSIQLNALPDAWKTVPMARANLPVQVIPLASIPGTLTTVCRFPDGFERISDGGYLAAEEFLVLEGVLNFEGVAYERGDLVSVPRSYHRSGMSMPHGCTVLAWFGGSADYIGVNELDPSETPGPVESVQLIHGAGEQTFETPDAVWRCGGAVELSAPDEWDECILADLSAWAGGEIGYDPRKTPGGFLRSPKRAT